MKEVKSICIFGTGSAGWLTAYSLASQLGDVRITILNSKNHTNIGVGESTQQNFVDLFGNADLQNLMDNTDATLKHGIYYRNWNEKNTEYWHPFSNLSSTNYHTSAHYYQQMINYDPKGFKHEDYYKRVHSSYAHCVTNKTSSLEMPFALHIDANLLAKYVESMLQNFIEIINFDQYDVKIVDGKISSIVCDGRSIEADLFVDCSGFNRVLISKISECKDDNYEAAVDSAIFGRVYYDENKTDLFPYTRAEAHDNGWCWTTPLKSKIGTGYIYNSNFCSEDEAKANFSKYWNGRIKEDTMRKLNFSSKALLQPWESNVVAIGLSSGFIEPLEATGISWMVVGANALGECLRNRFYDQTYVNYYNSRMRCYIEDIQDFIDTHYVLSNRKDTEFWRYQTSRTPSNRLQKRLQLYKEQMPNKSNRNVYVPWAFNDVSWIDILNGYEFKYDPISVNPMKHFLYETV